MKRRFWKITFGHCLIVVVLLFLAVIYLMNQQIATNSAALRQEIDLREKLSETVYNLNWYKEQGINFKDARKYNIEPPKANKK